MARTPEAKTENPKIPPGSFISVTLIRSTGERDTLLEHYVGDVKRKIAQSLALVRIDSQKFGPTQYLIRSVWPDEKSMRASSNIRDLLKTMEQTQGTIKRTIISKTFTTYWIDDEIHGWKETAEKVLQALARSGTRY